MENPLHRLLHLFILCVYRALNVTANVPNCSRISFSCANIHKVYAKQFVCTPLNSQSGIV